MEEKKNRFGRIGFWLALSPVMVQLLIALCAMAGVPGFG